MDFGFRPRADIRKQPRLPRRTSVATRAADIRSNAVVLRNAAISNARSDQVRDCKTWCSRLSETTRGHAPGTKQCLGCSSGGHSANRDACQPAIYKLLQCPASATLLEGQVDFLSSNGYLRYRTNFFRANPKLAKLRPSSANGAGSGILETVALGV